MVYLPSFASQMDNNWLTEGKLLWFKSGLNRRNISILCGCNVYLAEVKEGNQCDLLSVTPFLCLNRHIQLTQTYWHTCLPVLCHHTNLLYAKFWLGENLTSERQSEVCQCCFLPHGTPTGIRVVQFHVYAVSVMSVDFLSNETQGKRFNATDTCW